MTLQRLTKHWQKNNLGDGAVVFFPVEISQEIHLMRALSRKQAVGTSEECES